MSKKINTITRILTNTMTMQADVDAIAQARHIAAHALLGLQTLTDTRLSGEEKLVIRVFMPDAQHIVILDKKTQKPLATLTQVDPRGFFVAKLRRKKRFAYQLQVSSNGQVQVVEDDVQNQGFINRGKTYAYSKYLRRASVTVDAVNPKFLSVLVPFNDEKDFPEIKVEFDKKTDIYTSCNHFVNQQCINFLQLKLFTLLINDVFL